MLCLKERHVPDSTHMHSSCAWNFPHASFMKTGKGKGRWGENHEATIIKIWESSFPFSGDLLSQEIPPSRGMIPLCLWEMFCADSYQMGQGEQRERGLTSSCVCTSFNGFLGVFRSFASPLSTLLCRNWLFLLAPALWYTDSILGGQATYW